MKTLIAQLNHVAGQRSIEGESSRLALEATADLFGLEAVADYAEGTPYTTMRIYQAADGSLINCWLEADGNGVVDRIEDGGLGFDEQVGWYINDLITQADAARQVGVSTQAVHNRIRAGDLRGYVNPEATAQRQGSILVRQSEIIELWHLI